MTHRFPHKSVFSQSRIIYFNILYQALFVYFGERDISTERWFWLLLIESTLVSSKIVSWDLTWTSMLPDCHILFLSWAIKVNLLLNMITICINRYHIWIFLSFFQALHFHHIKPTLFTCDSKTYVFYLWLIFCSKKHYILWLKWCHVDSSTERHRVSQCVLSIRIWNFLGARLWLLIVAIVRLVWMSFRLQARSNDVWL